MINKIMNLIVVLTLMAMASGAVSLECEASGYCSLGQSKPWIGDIREGAKLREMLVSVSFRKELIVVAVTYAGWFRLKLHASHGFLLTANL